LQQAAILTAIEIQPSTCRIIVQGKNTWMNELLSTVQFQVLHCLWSTWLIAANTTKSC
jgi:hypothetical protein